MMMISVILLLSLMTCGALAAPSAAALTCTTGAMMHLGLSKTDADNLCNSCRAGLAPGAVCTTCAKCHSCIKFALTITKAKSCLPAGIPPLSPPPSPPPPKVIKPSPPPLPAGTTLTCSQTVQLNLKVSKAVGDALCLACPVHNQGECKTCVKAAGTIAEAKACPGSV